MKPSGSASRKNWRSASVRTVPERPKIAARASRLDKNAPDIAALQRRAALGRLSGIADRPRLDAVEDALIAEIGAHDADAKLAQDIGLRFLEMQPFLLGRVFAAQRAEL